MIQLASILLVVFVSVSSINAAQEEIDRYIPSLFAMASIVLEVHISPDEGLPPLMKQSRDNAVETEKIRLVEKLNYALTRRCACQYVEDFVWEDSARDFETGARAVSGYLERRQGENVLNRVQTLRLVRQNDEIRILDAATNNLVWCTRMESIINAEWRGNEGLTVWVDGPLRYTFIVSNKSALRGLTVTQLKLFERAEESWHENKPYTIHDQSSSQIYKTLPDYFFDRRILKLSDALTSQQRHEKYNKVIDTVCSILAFFSLSGG